MNNKHFVPGGEQVPARGRQTNIHPSVLAVRDNECLLRDHLVSLQYLSVNCPCKSFVFNAHLFALQMNAPFFQGIKQVCTKPAVIFKTGRFFKGNQKRLDPLSLYLPLLLTPVGSVIVNHPPSVRYGILQACRSSPGAPSLGPFVFQFERTGAMLPVTHAGWVDVCTGCDE